MFATLKTPDTVATGTPLGSRICSVMMSMIFLEIQDSFNISPSLTVTSGNDGCARTKEGMKLRILYS